MSGPEGPTSWPLTLLCGVVGAVLFVVLATGNSGGYRYGASDQAFYLPAVAMTVDPSLFPRDRPLFEPQMRLWPGRAVLAWMSSTTERLPAVFAGMYLTTLMVLFLAALALARSLGANWQTVAAFLALLTLKHQITHTGANSLEGYAHPRMLAFAFGVAALACFLRQRRMAMALALMAAAVVHVTTASWFATSLGVGTLWTAPRRTVIAVTALAAAAAALVLTMTPLSGRLAVMDTNWILAIGDRSYLFSAQWPISTWILNLGYAVAIATIFRRRRTLGRLVTGESGFVAGLFTLVVAFLISVPLAESRLALAVQLQVNRVFWLLDFAAAFYIAWWLVSDLARMKGARIQWAIVAAIILASVGRSAYLLGVAPARPAVQYDLSKTSWTDVMAWIRQQPEPWHVLADPQHVARFGSSVRVAALRDTLLDAGKDPAMAIYDRDAGMRVLERVQALADFDTFTTADVRSLAGRYNLQVFVDRADRQFDFPILYRNDGFIAYDLR